VAIKIEDVESEYSVLYGISRSLKVNIVQNDSICHPTKEVFSSL
jgi:hypothetical protein